MSVAEGGVLRAILLAVVLVLFAAAVVYFIHLDERVLQCAVNAGSFGLLGIASLFTARKEGKHGLYRGPVVALPEPVACDPDLAREIAERGHVVGVHGYDHKILSGLSAMEVRGDLKRTLEALPSIIETLARARFCSVAICCSRTAFWTCERAYSIFPEGVVGVPAPGGFNDFLSSSTTDDAGFCESTLPIA